MVIRPLAGFLRSYQLDGGYTPGPFYLAATLLGLAGALSLAGRRGRRPPGRAPAFACCLFFTTAAVLLLASDITEFSWRYQLPAIVTLPPAGALGLAVILARLRRRRGDAPEIPAAGPRADQATPAR
jgi:hypothetical protein